MKTPVKKLLIAALALCLVLSACAPAQTGPTATPGPSPSAEPSATPAPERAEVKLALIAGPTGVGAAKLLADNDQGESANDYTVTMCTDNQQVMAGLTNGEFDIAALATNVASTLYHKSNGGIQIAALNTLGVLYILGPDDKPISSLAELRGKTLHAFGQGANPEYVLTHLLRETGLDPAEVDIVWGTADEINAAMLQGKGDYCMLPVPAATALEVKSQGAIQSYISLSDVWDELQSGSRLTMGCVVVRTQFAQERPQVVSAFLEEYERSIAYMADPVNMALSSNLNPAHLVEQYAIAPSAAIAGKAIPQCNLIYLDGEDMRSAIQGYYEALYAADPASIGGSIPDDAFYFIPGQP